MSIYQPQVAAQDVFLCPQNLLRSPHPFGAAVVPYTVSPHGRTTLIRFGRSASLMTSPQACMFCVHLLHSLTKYTILFLFIFAYDRIIVAKYILNHICIGYRVHNFPAPPRHCFFRATDLLGEGRGGCNRVGLRHFAILLDARFFPSLFLYFSLNIWRDAYNCILS